jgi:Flp pilus assembly protein TadG
MPARKRKSGAAILEFALIAPVLLALLIFIIYFSYAVLVRHALESGLNTGLTQAALKPSQTVPLVVQAVNRRSMGLFSVDSSNIQLTRYPSVQDAMNDTNGQSVQSVTPGSVIRCTVKYTVTFMTIGLR